MQVQEKNTLVIGASIAGLAAAASLQKQSVEYSIIERSGQVAAPWRNHYDRLHLHTNKRCSNLPYKKFDSKIPRYPSKQQVIDYLEAYQAAFNIHPVFNTEALSVKHGDGCWLTETSSGTYKSKYLVMATGAYGKARPVYFKGMETFSGTVMHSYQYKTGKDFTGKKVLVVGFGNSACEIAIDLYEQGALPAMSVRSPVNIIPRDVLGIPVLELSLLLSRLSPSVADKLNAPLLKLLTGDITQLGLKKMPYGPLEQISRDAMAPVLDIGTLAHIRKGHIQIHGGVAHMDGSKIYFTDGKEALFDAVIAAIGYNRDDASMLAVDKTRFEDLRRSTAQQRYFGSDGLYFCGYWISPTGQIREIAADAKKIARHIAHQESEGLTD